MSLGRERTVRGSLESTGQTGDPPSGTTLVREWKGIEVRATKTDGGWEHDDTVYRSLSALVKAVTGSHCSGRAWFGLKPRKKAQQRN